MIKPKHNHAASIKVPPRAVALASGMAILFTANGVPTASAAPVRSNRAAMSAVNSAEQEAQEVTTLTTVLTDLQEGKKAKVTAKPIEVAGAVNGVATGRPLVFNVGKETFFAYTQDYKPDFKDATPAAIAGTMTILPAQFPGDHEMPLADAHVNKSGELVLMDNRNHHHGPIPVGVVTGGDNPKG
jgi:hypothetical protein